MSLRIYTVRPGDTLSAIARVFGMSVDQLLEINFQIENPNLIRAGQTILVPDMPDAPSVHATLAHAGFSERLPAWMKIALREEGTVEHEPGNNPRILEYHATTSLDWAEARLDSTPWCSSFTNWCVRKAGLPGTNSAWARSWESWGQPLHEPREGCIAVFSRTNARTKGGHVGFYLSETEDSVRVLGGNQGNSVCRSSYPKDGPSGGYHYRLLGYRWPA